MLEGSPKAAETVPRLRPTGRAPMVLRGTNGGSRPPQWWGDDHEQHEPKCNVAKRNVAKRNVPSARRSGRWLRPRRMLDVHAELRLLQVGPDHRGAADRVGAAGRGR